MRAHTSCDRERVKITMPCCDLELFSSSARKRIKQSGPGHTHPHSSRLASHYTPTNHHDVPTRRQMVSSVRTALLHDPIEEIPRRARSIRLAGSNRGGGQLRRRHRAHILRSWQQEEIPGGLLRNRGPARRNAIVVPAAIFAVRFALSTTRSEGSVGVAEEFASQDIHAR